VEINCVDFLWNLLSDQLADQYRNQRIENDGRIIVFSYALRFGTIWGFFDHKIQPVFLEFVRLFSIDQMNNEHQEKENEKKNQRLY
jgi:hypothetical protein